MPRVKRGVTARKKRTNVLKQTKGYRWGRKSKEKAAKEALLHALSHAFRGRKQKKRDFRALWNVKVGAATKQDGLSYSKFMGLLKKENIGLNRKMLAELAEEKPAAFKKIVAEINK